jgi:hypothetical protein
MKTESEMNEYKSWEEMSDLEKAQCIYWDLYKDAHGIRPRGVDTSSWTLADFTQEFDYLNGLIQKQEDDRAQEEAEAVESFEARVQEVIEAGAGTREAALRWIMDSTSCQGDWEFLCYEFGLPYGYFKKAA